ncbi:MAG: histidinol-phosphatase [Saprospiraceae bacterium]|nr:MAG: histidinol-phosphatase [Saprospiraceae bacterium]
MKRRHGQMLFSSFATFRPPRTPSVLPTNTHAAMRTLLSLFMLLLTVEVSAQIPAAHIHPPERAIRFPHLDTLLTLSCDLHTHSVFSDGSVWPDIRVQEAVRDSLDALAVTEHLEYQPHREDLPHPDRNRAFQLAEQYARPYGLIVIPGSEITRDMPPGHCNALFISDANRLLHDDYMAVFKEARAQGAFIFWNHPNWVAQRPDGMATLTDLHRQLIAEGLLHGIEVVNDVTFSEEALQIALDYDLTLIGTSDIHGLIDWQYRVAEGGHRPVTLVFARERSAEAIREALFQRRTAVWYDNTLIAREREMLPLLSECISVEKTWYDGDRSVARVVLRNESDAHFILENLSGFTLHEHPDIVLLPPHARLEIGVKTLTQLDAFTLRFRVWNALTAPGRHPVIELVARGS